MKKWFICATVMLWMLNTMAFAGPEELSLEERKCIRESLYEAGYTEVRYIAQDRFRVCLNDANAEYAMVDRYGNVLTDQTYSHFFELNEGRICVGDGYIDLDGNVIVEPIWDACQSYFSEGRAWVLKDGKYGFVNFEGTIISQPQWDYVHPFRAGFAVVASVDREADSYIDTWTQEETYPIRYGFIDSLGNVVAPPTWDALTDFSSGFAVATQYGDINGREKRYAYVNTQGEQITDFCWECANPFSEGYAMAMQYGRWFILDTEGNASVVPIEYGIGSALPDSVLGTFRDGLIPVKKYLKEGRTLKYNIYSCGYMNPLGEIQIPVQYKSAGPFKDGYASASFGEGLCGAIDSEGKSVISFEWDDIWNLGGGVFAVCKNDLWGITNVATEGSINLQFEYIYPLFNHAGGYGIAVRKWGDVQRQLSIVDLDGWLWDGGLEGNADYCYLDTNGQILAENVDMLSDADRWLCGISVYDTHYCA